MYYVCTTRYVVIVNESHKLRFRPPGSQKSLSFKKIFCYYVALVVKDISKSFKVVLITDFSFKN